jgi:PAS domain S-box-containing protein
MARILIVDDNADNRYYLETLFSGTGYETVSAGNGIEALAAARGRTPDLVIADILMPEMDGYTLCKEWRADALLAPVPFVFYTATYTEDKDEAFALSLGADRFLLKPQPPEDLLRVVTGLLEGTAERPTTSDGSDPDWDMVFLKGHNEALLRKLQKKMHDLETANSELALEVQKRREAEATLRTLHDASPVGIAWADHRGTIRFLNRRFMELFGYRVGQLPTVEAWYEQAYPDPAYRADLVGLWGKALEDSARSGNPMPPIEARIHCADGSYRIVNAIGALIEGYTLAIFYDLTEQKQLEAQLLQSQKMEAIGRLAGGIAHDFNNILTAMYGWTQLLAQSVPPESTAGECFPELIACMDRASGLTRSILSFSRRQEIAKKPVRLNTVVSGTESVLQRLLHDGITLRFDLCDADPRMYGDSGQLGQLLMNLVVNARDAINGTGTVTITTALEADEHNAGAPPVVVLRVSDTGCGMEESVRQHLFEPFFTTKEAGKGTGFGLSIVFSIIKQHGARIEVESAPGCGTSFTMRFTAIHAGDAVNDEESLQPAVHGGGTILVADDDVSIRASIRLMLESAGYRVLEAADGNQAQAVLDNSGEKIVLAIIDLDMPGKSGYQVCRLARVSRPGMAIILLGDQAEEAPQEPSGSQIGMPCLLKPILPAVFLNTVHECISLRRSTTP